MIYTIQGNQIFTGRIDAEVEAPILWLHESFPTHWK